MSEWESRRKRSWGYYACLFLFMWPLILLPIQFLFAVSSLTAEAVAAAFMYSGLVVVLALGCGTRYRFRGINPGSRVVLSSIDDQYCQASEYDKPYN